MSKIGGNRPLGPHGPVTPPEPQAASKATDQRPPQTPNDGFERGATGAQTKKATEPSTINMKVEQDPRFNDPKFNELLKQTRHDPKALNALAHTLNLAFNRFNSDFQNDKAKATALLDEMAKNRFAQGAVEHARSELSTLRERMALSRQRMATQKRRVRALRQLAGRVADTRLAEEIAGIEARIEMLDTGWAEAFVGLGLGKALFEPQDDEAPEHLRKVVKTQVSGTKKAADAEAVGEAVADMHPARMVTKLAAREIDGNKQKKISNEVMERVRNEAGGAHGRTTQAIAALYELFESDE